MPESLARGSQTDLILMCFIQVFVQFSISDVFKGLLDRSVRQHYHGMLLIISSKA
jgi:hypothetical protein